MTAGACEALKDRDTPIDDWVRDRLKEQRFVAMFTLSFDGDDATVHLLCEPGVQPDTVACLEVLERTVKAALKNARQQQRAT
jgi:hypothetical protein